MLSGTNTKVIKCSREEMEQTQRMAQLYSSITHSQVEEQIQHDLSNITSLSKKSMSKVQFCIKSISDPALKNHVQSSHFNTILQEIDEEFDVKFELSKIMLGQFADDKSKSLKARKRATSVVYQTPLYLFVQEVIGLFNKIILELNSASLFELEITESFEYVRMFDRWITEFENAGYIPNPIHKIMLAFQSKLTKKMITAHINIGILNSHNKEKATLHYEQAETLLHLLSQAAKELKKIYDYEIVEEKLNLFYGFTWCYTYRHQFSQARIYLEKMLKELENRDKIEKGIHEAIVNYACHIINFDQNELHQGIHYLRIALTILNTKYIVSEKLGVDYYTNRIIGVYKNALKNYEHVLPQICERSVIPLQYINGQFRVEAENMKEANCVNLIVNRFNNDCRKEKKHVTWQNIPEIAFAELEDLVDELNQLRNSRQAMKVKHNEVNSLPMLVSENALGSINEIQLISNMSQLTITSELTLPQGAASIGTAPITESSEQPILQNEKHELPSTTSNTTSPSLNIQPVTKEIGPYNKHNNARNSSVSQSTPPPVNTITRPVCKMAQDYGFDSEIFKDASIQQLKGAKGLFIAYRSDVPLMQSKRLKKRAVDSDIDERFQSLLCDPYRAGKQNENGFKWVPKKDKLNGSSSAVLLGKITRLPFRLFPIATARNANGETAYLYGTIKNTKKGKRENRYK